MPTLICFIQNVENFIQTLMHFCWFGIKFVLYVDVGLIDIQYSNANSTSSLRELSWLDCGWGQSSYRDDVAASSWAFHWYYARVLHIFGVCFFLHLLVRLSDARAYLVCRFFILMFSYKSMKGMQLNFLVVAREKCMQILFLTALAFFHDQ